MNDPTITSTRMHCPDDVIAGDVVSLEDLGTAVDIIFGGGSYGAGRMSVCVRDVEYVEQIALELANAANMIRRARRDRKAGDAWPNRDDAEHGQYADELAS